MLFILYLLLIVQALPDFRSRIVHRHPTPNEVVRAYNDIKKNLFLVETIDDLRPVHLIRYGAIRIRSTNSIVTNSELATKALLPKYHPLRFNFTVVTEREHMLHHEKEFYEVSFEDAQVETTISDWQPITPCHYNGALTKTTYGYGWSVDTTTGFSASFKFSEPLVYDIKKDVSYSEGVSGSVSCDVALKSTLQVQLRTEYATVSGVKMRQIHVRRNLKFTDAKFAWLEYGDFEEVKEYDLINKKSVITACITKKKMLMCDEYTEKYKEKEGGEENE